MKTIDRRSLVRGAFSAACVLPLNTILHYAAPAAAIQPSCGCCVRFGASLDSGGRGMPKFVSSTGDAETDSFLGAALARLASTFEVNPGFTFFEDGNTPNAFASPDTLLEYGSGTVMMGTHLFNRMIRVNDGGVSLLMVCAHEFGHIHQQHSEYLQELLMLDDTNKPIELHADYLAGYYLARRRDEYPDLDLRRVGDEVYKTGDFEFGNKLHHGTPDERFDALTAGYRLGLAGSPNITQAAGSGVQFIERAYQTSSSDQQHPTTRSIQAM